MIWEGEDGDHGGDFGDGGEDGHGGNVRQDITTLLGEGYW